MVNNDAKSEFNTISPTYDFVIVGAGTAGSVVANRLTELRDWKVLLIEAGGNPTMATEIPSLFISNYGTKEDWNFRTEPQERACLSYLDKKCYWPRGKVLGGTSSINGMYYVRGNKEDYEDWCSYGNSGWCYEDILPYFKKSEKIQNVDKVNLKYHGNDGLLNVENSAEIYPLEDMILKAHQELGLKINNDINGQEQMGVSTVFTTTKNGVRQSTARAFLSPIKHRPNLHVVKNCIVHKLNVDNFNVTGVTIFKDGKKILINIRKEVIISAGAVNTPKILLASGIGREKHLNSLNITTKVNLAVGENLQDHIFAPIFFIKESNDDANSVTNIQKIFYDYILHRKGPLISLSPQKVVSFINTTDNSSTMPNIQNLFIFLAPNQSNIVDIFGQHRFSNEFHDQFNNLNKHNLILIVYVTLLQPKSKGKILLRSNNMEEEPLIEANYLNDVTDLKTLVEGMKDIIKLNYTDIFKRHDLKLHWMKLEACENYEQNSDRHLECIAKELTGTLYHAVGSAKMGPSDDENSVVDEKLKVRSIDNLRVIDASVMPKIVRGNTMAPVLMIAEKGSDMIKEQWS